MEDIDSDLAVILPKVDDLTDFLEEDTAIPKVFDVPGHLKVVKSEEGSSKVPCTPEDQNPLAKKPRKENSKVSWRKNKPIYSKWSDMNTITKLQSS